MKKAFSKILPLLLLLTIISCNDDGLEIESTQDFEEYIKEEMEFQNIPTLSVLTFNLNSILYEGYFGEPKIGSNNKLKADHMFLLASISKVVTATALLQLYDQGLFSLDDSINDYLSFEVKNPNFTTEITFRMLLTHTSSIADGSALDDQYYYGVDSPVELSTFLKSYLTKDGDLYNASENFYDFEPGNNSEYSNTGNALIALLVEEISNTKFNEYCKSNIFIPLGMNHTFWRLDEIEGTIVQPYKYTNGKFEEIQHYTFTDYPNGGLRSTSRDMFKFLRAIVQKGKSGNYQLLKESTVAAMLTPQIPSIDNETGLHLFKMNQKHNLWGHDGGEQGVATIMAFSPETFNGAIILTNQGDVELDEMLIETYLFGLNL